MSPAQAVYRGMTRPQLDAAYNNRAAVPAFDRISNDWISRSRAVHEHGRSIPGIPYGPGRRQRLDLLLPSAGKSLQPSPVLAFIHGGYWQGGSVESCAFLAEHWPAAGVAVCLIEYTIAPEGSMRGMVEDITLALDWLAASGSRYDLDTSSILLAGHSAGGHLAALGMSHASVASGLAISGLFDLEPIRLCYLNDKLALTSADVERYSPARRLDDSSKPLIIAVGGAELPELRRQSDEYAAALGTRATHLSLPGHDHFTVLEELCRPQGALHRRAGMLMGIEPATF